MIAQPGGHLETATTGGAGGRHRGVLARYVLFWWMISRRSRLPRFAAIVILAILGLTGSRFSPLQLSLTCALVVVATAIWEMIGSDIPPVVEPDVI